MLIPTEIFENLNYYLEDWTQNYMVVLGCDSQLTLVYKGNIPHHEFLKLPIGPEENYDPEDDYDPEDYGEEYDSREWLELLSGEGYEVKLLGNAFDCKGFIFTID